MTPEQKDRFEYTLDEAISIVAKRESERLHGEDRDGFPSGVSRALRALRRLQAGAEPSYDRLVPLFYVTWYQPRQINLAYQILQYYYSNEKKLHIIDYGCGALALNFALAAFMVDNGDREVCVHGIDPSRNMTEVGQEVWRQFVRIAEDFPELRDACIALEENMHVFTSIDEIHDDSISAAEDVWMLALHAVYPTNRNLVKKDFEEICNRFRPTKIVVTGYTRNREHILHVTGGELEDMSFPHEIRQNPESIFNPKRWERGFFPLTRKWRWELREGIKDQLEGEERSMVIQYLQGELEPDPRSCDIFGSPRSHPQ